MKLFDVYPLYDINIVKGQGCKVWDENGTEYLDLYGGPVSYTHLDVYKRQPMHCHDCDAKYLIGKVN